MPLALVPQPPFPDVPRAPGVPLVLRAQAAAQDAVILLRADAALLLARFGGPQWGLFDKTGAPVLTGDAVTGFDVRKGWRLSDFPIEDGGFATYDKVETPGETVLGFAVGGTAADRAAFLDAVSRAARSMELYAATSPERTYPSVSVTRYDFRRSGNSGAGLLIVEVWVQEVRVVAAGGVTGTRDARDQPAQNGGTVVPDAATPAQDAARAAGNGGAAGPAPPATTDGLSTPAISAGTV